MCPSRLLQTLIWLLLGQSTNSKFWLSIFARVEISVEDRVAGTLQIRELARIKNETSNKKWMNITTRHTFYLFPIVEVSRLRCSKHWKT
jgi:hypothetical protein